MIERDFESTKFYRQGNLSEGVSMADKIKEFVQSYFHGTKADLKVGDLVTPGNNSNYGDRNQANHVYFTSNLNVAAWGAELAVGDQPGRIYVVEPTGPIEDDPNVTNKRFPGNPTNSFRSRDSLRIVGEVKGWQGHSHEEIKTRMEDLERLNKEGAQIID